MSNTNYIDTSFEVENAPAEGSTNSKMNVKKPENSSEKKTGGEITDQRTHDLNEWNLKDIKRFFSMIVFGCRRSGKSHLVNNLIQKIAPHHKFTNVILISATAKVQKEYWDFVPDENKFDKLDNDHINGIYNDCLKLNEEYQQDPTSFEVEPYTLLIFDDMISDSSGKSIFWLQAVNRLYFAGRHAKIGCILLLQGFKVVAPIIRSNTDYLLYFRTMKKECRKGIASEYLTYSDEKQCLDDGLALMSNVTSETYCSMVIDKSEGQYASCFNEYCYCYKADPKLKNLDKVKIYYDYKKKSELTTLRSVTEKLFKKKKRYKFRYNPDKL
jgi:hypothetical protein